MQEYSLESLTNDTGVPGKVSEHPPNTGTVHSLQHAPNQPGLPHAANKAAPWSGAPTVPPTSPKDTPTYGSTTSSESPKSMSVGAITGLAVGIVALLLVVGAFMVAKKRTTSKRFSLGKASEFGQSQAVPLVSSKMRRSGSFGRLKSSCNVKEEPNMSGVFSAGHNDPFTRRHMRKGGIWDDPVLIAARIPLEKICIRELVARGGFGQVFMASYNGKTVAVKTLLPETATNIEEITALFAETKVMAKLDHPCIVSFVGIAWESLSTICCVTEYLVGGDLRALLNHFLSNNSRSCGFDHDKVKIALNIAQGLTYLHSIEPNILHRDLKSRNVLLDSQLNAKLTDFGVSRERTDGMMTNAVGTSLWMAPEVMMGSHYDGKADVFSLGVVLSELDTHKMPYSNVLNSKGRNLTEAAIMQKMVSGELQVEFSSKCPEEMRTLAQSCIAVDPKARPTAADVMTKLESIITSFDDEEVAL